jgi:hypothetical protein
LALSLMISMAFGPAHLLQVEKWRVYPLLASCARQVWQVDWNESIDRV